MKVHRDLNQLPKFRNAVLTIGSYDGVHTGHQEIIRRVNALAEQLQGESVLITFNPHPRLVVRNSSSALRLLSTLDEKIKLLRHSGINHLVVTPFTKTFSQQSPDEYIHHFLVKKFQPKRIVIGYDHRFGQGRIGDIDYLKKLEDKYQYQVIEISKQTVDDIAVSSTKVRHALQAGAIRTAHSLLNHPYTLSGIVIKGRQIGHTIGFPTANIAMDSPHKLIPADGIYAAWVHHKSQTYGGMLYIGKPLDVLKRTIEVNIFDFNQDIYGDLLILEFVKHIRDDVRFDDLESLKGQLVADKTSALKILQSYTTDKKQYTNK